jgi:hypothetical protein
MLTIIDRGHGLVVQKVTKPNGVLVRYQTVPESGILGPEYIGLHPTLAEARRAIGKGPDGKPL